MNSTDHAPIIAIAMLAARADGAVDSAEQRAVEAVVARVGCNKIGVCPKAASGYAAPVYNAAQIKAQTS